MTIKLRTACVSALLLAVGLGTAAPASATRMIATYSGVILNGSDPDGIFGPAFASLTGLNYTAVYRYDTDLGVRTTTPGEADSVVGGVLAGAPTPITYAGLTINGVTVQFPAIASGGVYISDGVAQHVVIVDSPFFNYLFNTLLNGTSATSLDQPLSAFGDSNSLGEFKIYDADSPLVIRASGFLSSETLNIAQASVPEPAAWTLLIGGFGLAGIGLRRRRRALA